MKRIFVITFLLASIIPAFAQEEEKNKDEEATHGFQKSKLFTGGSVTAGFSNGTTNLGIVPHFGYSFTKWLDLAASVGYSYVSQRDLQYYGDKARQTVAGPGAFVRIFPVHFLFAQAQYEYNFIKVKYIPGNNLPNETYKTSAPSFLVGGGYSNGKKDGNTYYYLSVLFDIAKNPNSPYLDELQRVLPIFRAGFNIALFQGGRN